MPKAPTITIQVRISNPEAMGALREMATLIEQMRYLSPESEYVQALSEALDMLIDHIAVEPECTRQ